MYLHIKTVEHNLAKKVGYWILLPASKFTEPSSTNCKVPWIIQYKDSDEVNMLFRRTWKFWVVQIARLISVTVTGAEQPGTEPAVSGKCQLLAKSFQPQMIWHPTQSAFPTISHPHWLKCHRFYFSVILQKKKIQRCRNGRWTTQNMPGSMELELAVAC